jgi:hypothetical protein
VPLDHLAQRIAQQEAELQALRREYEARQARLADLARRKEELEGQLRQLEADIDAVARGERPAPPTGGTPVPPAARPQTLAGLLVEVVRGAPGPVSVKQLADEVVRRKFPTTSQNIPELVKSRVSKMVARGVFRRVEGQGIILTEAKDRPQPPPTQAAAAKKGAKAAAPAKPAAAGRQQPSLRVILTDLLARSKGPVAVRDLAEQAKARGYRSKSKSFKDVIWVMLRQMDNVENVPGRGYRLKKR